MNRRSAFRMTLVAAAIGTFVILPSLVDFLMEWLWFGAMGYQDVFLRSLKAQAALGSSVPGWRFWCSTETCGSPISSIASPYIVLGSGAGTVQPAMLRREQLRQITGIGCAVLSLMVALGVSGEWLTWLQFRHGVPFGIADPILGHDIGFYVFRLPLLDLAAQMALGLLFVSLIGSAAAYVLAGALNFTKRGGVSVGRKARMHLSLLAAALFLVLALHAYLDIPTC